MVCGAYAPAPPPSDAVREVVVDARRVVRRGLDRFFGIDLNYIRDSDANRPNARPLDAALEEIGVKWLRYPGGEKSNYHLWSVPPYDKPQPHSLKWYGTVKGVRLDFDDFIRHARAAGAEPLVVVGYESEAKTGRTEAQWLADAVAWVRYSKAHGCGVRYWEIGNEDWNHRATPESMAQVVMKFAAEMKKADPAIQVGASGNNDAWWSRFLPIAGSSLDFLTVSEYTGWDWKRFDKFEERPELADTALGAVRAIQRYAPPAARERLRVIVSETNTKDYAEGGWPDNNDLGHALVTFATLGRLASQPLIESAMIWTTRWMTDTEAPSSEFYALDAKNRLIPTGQALKMWGRYTQAELIGTEGEDAFAARSADGRLMTVWILNRETSPCTVHVTLDGDQPYTLVRPHRFAGVSQGDRRPVETALPAIELRHNSWSEEVPPLSVTAYTLEAATR